MDYWKDTISEAFEDAGITATDEQIETVAQWAESGHENYSMAMGHDVASANLAAERERERKAGWEAAERERNKVHCRECNGRGRIVASDGIRSSDSECSKCRGEGRRDP